MTVEIDSAQTESASQTSLDLVGPVSGSDPFAELMRALRLPHLVFGTAVSPDIAAQCEMADWEQIGATLKETLERQTITSADVTAVLRLAGEFFRNHGIRLDGSPWLCTVRDDEGPWVRYDLHTSLSPRHLHVWEERLADVLESRGLELDGFRLRLDSAGPR